MGRRSQGRVTFNAGREGFVVCSVFLSLYFDSCTADVSCVSLELQTLQVHQTLLAPLQTLAQAQCQCNSKQLTERDP